MKIMRPTQPYRLALLITVLIISTFISASRISGTIQTDSVTYRNGIVSSAHPLASVAGLEILKAGGNAFDAAVAIAAALNVVEPMMSGMGGYGTILTYHADNNQVKFLDSSGKIPLAMNSDLMRPPTPDYEANRRGPKSISTPGNVNAWHELSQFGNLEWSELFQPAILLAGEGFEVTSHLAFLIGIGFPDFPAYAKTFYGKDNRPIQAGERLIQEDLAKSLRLVADKGRSVFYEGALAQAIHSTMVESGSFLTIEDLRNDRGEWWDPIVINYRGYDVYTASPPANSFPALIRLGIMEKLMTGEYEHNSADYLHSFAEVTKHAFWCRLKYAGDPEISPPPLDRLISDTYLEQQALAIDLNEASEFTPPGLDNTEGKHTTHFVVADKWGNIVSATQTLGNLFGSKVMPEGTGIWMNNSLAYCTYEPKGNPMDAIAGQRKLSGDCPVILFHDDKPWAALGTPGGHTIPQTVPQMIMNLVDFDMEIQDAINAPRISFVEPNFIAIENGIPDEIVNKLREKGHQIRMVQALGNAHGIRFHQGDDGTFLGYSGGADPRGEGRVTGF
jgi:gamma-glutamyltranspeptidase/glutathione hydrolase